MAGSPSIEQIVAQIRTALFGKDVRENIALGIEKCYEDAKAETQNAELKSEINLFDASATYDGWLYGDPPEFEKEPKNFAGQSAPIKTYEGDIITIWGNSEGFPIITLGSNDIDDPIAYKWCNTTVKHGLTFFEYLVPSNTPYITVGFTLANKYKIHITVDKSNIIQKNEEALLSIGNPNKELFYKDKVNTGWYYSDRGGVPTKIIASWAGQSDLIKVLPGDVVTIYGVSDRLEDGCNIITTNSYSFNSIQRIKYCSPIKLINGLSVIDYVVPDDATYISFSFGLANINSISVFAHEKLYNAKTGEVGAIGDSITYGHITPSITANPTWLEIVGSNLHCITYNHGLSGSGICDGSVAPLLTLLTNMTEAWLDCLVIAAGTNDYGDERARTLGTISDEPAQGTNFYASFKYLLVQAINKYPMAQILVITPMRRQNYAPNQYGISMEDIVNAEIEVSRYYGVKCFDFYHEGGINPAIQIQRTRYTQDGLHPNQKGINLFLGPRFTEAIKELISCRAG